MAVATLERPRVRAGGTYVAVASVLPMATTNRGARVLWVRPGAAVTLVAGDDVWLDREFGGDAQARVRWQQHGTAAPVREEPLGADEDVPALQVARRATAAVHGLWVLTGREYPDDPWRVLES